MTNWHEMGIHMIRIMDISDGVKDAHIRLVISPSAVIIRHIWSEVYKEGVRTGRVKHIELIPLDEKKELWNSTKEMCKDYELTKEQLITVSKVLYCIETYLNENYENTIEQPNNPGGA